MDCDITFGARFTPLSATMRPTKLIPRLQSNYSNGTMVDYILFSLWCVLQVQRVTKNRYTYAIVQV